MRLNTTRYTVCSDKISVDSCGYRIAVLADLHDTLYGKDNIDLAMRIENEAPDAIIVAGDLVTAKSGRDFSPALNLLCRLAKNRPVYYALGNHEHRLKNKKNGNGEDSEYWQKVKNIPGVIVIDNETKVLEGTGDIFVTGLTLPKRFYTKGKKVELHKKDITAEIEEKKPAFTILVAHNPLYFTGYAEWGADLVLSGHLHGGIVRFPIVGGLLSPQISFFPKYDKGLFKIGESTMIVSAGLGKHTIPIRLWNPAELVIVEIMNK